MSELYIGFMSGTSLDGVDASLVRTDGANKFEPIYDLHLQYPNEFRNKMRNLLSSTEHYLALEKQLTEFHIEATTTLLEKANLKPQSIKALGFHGQTLLHNPEQRITLQIGNPHLLAQKTKIDVIHDFRRRDIALGGFGAPLVPIFHKLLMQQQCFPVAVLNIGGVANITYIDENNLIAFDTGPGSALIDDAMQKYFNKNFDHNGEVAKIGKIDQLIVDQALKQSYFTTPYPKALDRNKFKFLEKTLSNHNPEDIIASLTYFSSASIAIGVDMLPEQPKQIFLCGGGSNNHQMIKWLAEILLQKNYRCSIENISKINNLDPDYIESQAFAYLAARFFKKLPGAFKSTTNTSQDNVCGCLVQTIPT